jgi:hypothetical protein
MLLCELELIGFQKVPFTCPYSPPIGRVRLLWPVGLVAFTTFSYTLAAIEAAALRSPQKYAVLMLAVFATAALAARWRESLIHEPPALVFEEEEEDAAVTLQLGSL